MSTTNLIPGRSPQPHAEAHGAPVRSSAVLFATLAVAFWIFQVAQHEKFSEMAENNHLRTLPLPAPRGVLFDRDGKVLVENQNTYQHRARARADQEPRSDDSTLALATGADEAQLAKRSTVADGSELPADRPDLERDAANRSLRSARGARAARDHRTGKPSRRYPSNEMAAHLFGYVSEVTEAQLQRPEYQGVDRGDLVGQAGIEQAYNKNPDGGRKATARSWSTASAAKSRSSTSTIRSKANACS